jgi:hypothetical protein
MAWTTVTDSSVSNDTGSWTTTVTSAISATEGSLWRNPLVTPTSASFANVGEAPENMLFDAEDMTLEPELVQGDFDDWVVLAPPS